MYMHFPPPWWIRYSHRYRCRIRDHALETVSGISCVACIKFTRESSSIATAFCFVLTVDSPMNFRQTTIPLFSDFIDADRIYMITIREMQHITPSFWGWLKNVWCVYVYVWRILWYHHCPWTMPAVSMMQDIHTIESHYTESEKQKQVPGEIKNIWSWGKSFGVTCTVIKLFASPK